MSDATTTRALIARVISNLKHASEQPGLNPTIVDGLITPAIRNLETVIARLDAYHREIRDLVDTAATARALVDGQLRRAERTLQRLMQILGPDVPAHAECAGCATEIAAALAELRAYGIAYQARKPADEPEDEERGA